MGAIVIRFRDANQIFFGEKKWRKFLQSFLEGVETFAKEVISLSVVAVEWLALGLSVAWADYENRLATK